MVLVFDHGFEYPEIGSRLIFLFMTLCLLDKLWSWFSIMVLSTRRLGLARLIFRMKTHTWLEAPGNSKTPMVTINTLA
jgi:hypothetical protein